MCTARLCNSRLSCLLHPLSPVLHMSCRQPACLSMCIRVCTILKNLFQPIQHWNCPTHKSLLCKCKEALVLLQFQHLGCTYPAERTTIRTGQSLPGRGNCSTHLWTGDCLLLTLHAREHHCCLTLHQGLFSDVHNVFAHNIFCCAHPEACRFRSGSAATPTCRTRTRRASQVGRLHTTM